MQVNLKTRNETMLSQESTLIYILARRMNQLLDLDETTDAQREEIESLASQIDAIIGGK